MIQQEHSVTVREIEARAANRPWPSAGGAHIDPDILTEARRELAADDVIGYTSAITRGGRRVRTWSLSNAPGKNTAIQQAAGRKRLLTARHMGWAETSPRNPKGLIGQAGENVVRHLLDDLDPYSHIHWDTDHILGTHVPGGTIDASTFLTVERTGVPLALTVLVEIKNQRQWFYSTNPSPHRFLAKAAQLQFSNPKAQIVPTFVSSWRHNSTLELGRLLGFYGIGYRLQYVLDRAEIPPRHFTEVVEDLGYNDLHRGVEPNISLRHAFEISLPRDSAAVAERWNEAAGLVLPYSEAIRDADTEQERRAWLDELLQDVIGQLGAPAT